MMIDKKQNMNFVKKSKLKLTYKKITFTNFMCKINL